MTTARAPRRLSSGSPWFCVEAMGEEDGEKKGRFTFCKKLFAKGSTFSMVVFVFFEVCCFQLCQVCC